MIMIIIIQTILNFLFLKLARKSTWKLFSILAFLIFPALIVLVFILPFLSNPVSPDVTGFATDKSIIFTLLILIIVSIILQILINIKASAIKQKLLR